MLVPTPTSALGALVALSTLLSFNPFSASVLAAPGPSPSVPTGPARLDERASSASTGARIALSKRTNRMSWAGLRLKMANGVVNLDNLNNAVVRLQQKYQAGASRYHWRTGKTLPGFSLKTYEAWSKIALAPITNRVGLSKRQRDPLTNYLDGNLWAGTVQVGTPPQEFTIDFDTGSSDFWIPGVGVTGFTTFDPSKSSTAKNSTDRFSIAYGDGSTVSGPVYTDTVTVAGLSAENQHFSPVTTMGTDFGETPVDGILGMGFESISNLGERPFFQTLWEEGKVSQNLFSFVLGNADDGELFLGGLDESKYTGPLTYTPVVQKGYWQVHGTPYANGAALEANQNMIIDTGTTLVIGPRTAVAKFFQKIRGARRWRSGYYMYPCSASFTAEFEFGGVKYAIPSEYLNLGLTAVGSSYCVAAIVGEDVGVDAWVIGDAFLRSVYTVFNAGTSSVGFANLA
ncbi:hypothetical protein JCM3770_004932 [Rhodotorula araucariae]